jgi:hypothetical protein
MVNAANPNRVEGVHSLKKNPEYNTRISAGKENEEEEGRGFREGEP